MANETGAREPIAGNRIEKITTADLKPEVPEIGGSVIVLQRNASDRNNRKAPEDSPEFGTLDLGEAEKTRVESKEFFEKVFDALSEEERGTLYVLVVAADTKLNLPDGRKSEHKRAVETADQVVVGLKEVMSGFSVTDKQLMNKTGKPIELSSGRLTAVRILEDSPDFVEFLKDKCTTDGVFDEQKFWVSYERDEYRQERERMGAEGPIDIANRVNNYIRVLANAAKSWHNIHPGRRLVVWAVSHYDSISPLVKKIVGMDEKTFLGTYLKVDSRAGVVFNLGKDGNATSEIKGQKYNVSLA